MVLDLSLEREYKGVVAGVDEAGRGPWCGPVVASAVIVDQSQFLEGVNDSKKLSKAKRERLYDEIFKNADVGVGEASAQEIDQLNILEATKLAMARAVSKLSVTPDTILVDGNQCLNIEIPSHPIIKGDSLSLSIAAASIVAKVTRDRVMSELAQKYPEYGWESNSGYGTKQHQEALSLYGVTPHHRKSFKPVAKLIREGNIADVA
jgi:ribonuclease HII